MEAEDGVGAAVVEEAEAAHLVALEAVVAAVVERHLRHAEHADLLVQVAQVRDLQLLRLELEAGEAVAPEVAFGGVEPVAAVAGLEDVGFAGPKNFARPAPSSGVNELSRARIGFGG